MPPTSRSEGLRVTRKPAPAYLPFEVTVTSVRRLSPTFVRVTLGGPDLVDFDGGGPLGTRDTRLKVVLPTAGATGVGHGQGRRAWAGTDTSDPEWYRHWLAHDPTIRDRMRTYTARSARLDAAAPEIDIDFVLHVNLHGPAVPRVHGPRTPGPESP